MYHDAYQIYEHLEKFNHQEPDVEAIRQLFAEKPKEARQYLFGQTLLHKAVETYSDRLDVVDVLLDAYPEAVNTEDDNGLLPIHRLLLSRDWYPNSLVVTERLLTRSPETVVASTKSGALPLHLACQRTESVDVVRFLVSCFPDACRYRDGGGKFPLDYALEVVDPSSRIVQVLVDRYPVLLSFPDDAGRLPLHKFLKRSNVGGRRASKYDRTVEVVVNGYEGSLRLQDNNMQTPLLQACVDNNSLSQVYCLLRKWPEQASPNGGAGLVFDSTTFNGEMLYSSLTSRSVKLDHVQRWLQQSPHLLCSPDLNGRVPLHYAVLSESDRAYNIVLLCCVMPEQQRVEHGPQPAVATWTSTSSIFGSKICPRPPPIQTVDHDGRLPIHFAAASPTCGPEILELLIESYPEGLMQADNDGRLPWHYAHCSRQDLVFEKTCERFPALDVDLDLVPEEIRWDILQVTPDDPS